MAKRELGIERVFDLGSYKSLRVKESVVIDDDNFTEDEVSGLRTLLLLRSYEVFGINKMLMEAMAEVQTRNGESLTGEQILEIINETIEVTKEFMEESKDA